MALIRWEPLSELDQMQRQMDRMVGQLLGTRMRGLPSLEGAMPTIPSVEVFETDGEVVLNCELPGLDPEQVTVEITEDAVQISGELQRSHEVKEDTYYRSERHFGSFRRIVPLPDRINDEEAKATFRNGLLTIRAPLAEAPARPKPHKLEIATEAAPQGPEAASGQ